MKETMAEETAVFVVREELINDNALLRFVYDNTKDKDIHSCTVYVRYIQDRAIHETKIGRITLQGAYQLQQDDVMCIYGSNNSLLEYNQKGIAYLYSEDMQSYFATIYTDIIDYNINSVSFSTIMDGFFHCYGLMSPVDINRNDFSKAMKRVYRNNWVKGGRNHAR